MFEQAHPVAKVESYTRTAPFEGIPECMEMRQRLMPYCHAPKTKRRASNEKIRQIGYKCLCVCESVNQMLSSFQRGV